jgi:DNA-binding GntR family transcriptional regulator
MMEGVGQMPDRPQKPLSSLDRQSLSHRALDALRDAILEGQFEPGARLREVEISNQLGVSRSTVREAVLRLVSEGLVAVEPRRGACVRQLSAEEVRQIYEVREVLECLAAHRAAQVPREQREAALMAAWERLQQCQDGPFAERIRADLEFHESICVLSGNAPLLDTWRQLARPTAMAVVSAGPDRSRKQQTPEWHRTVLDALLNGDPDAAAEAVRRHMRAGAESLIKALEEQSAA